MKRTINILLFPLLLSWMMTACSVISPSMQKSRDNISKIEKKSLLQKANSFNNQGVEAYRKGDYKSSINHYLKAIKIKESVLGTEHLNTATSYNNLGLVYKRIAQHDKALLYISEALKVREKNLGRVDSQTAQS